MIKRWRVRWTPEMDEYLVKKRLEGMAFHRIGAVVGVSRSAAQVRFKKLVPNAGYVYVPHVRVYDYQTREAVVAMKMRGLTLRQISNKMGLRVTQVHGIWNHWRDYESPRRSAA